MTRFTNGALVFLFLLAVAGGVAIGLLLAEISS